MEYGRDITEEPFASDALYVFANSDSGRYCMETDLATTISDEVYFEVVVQVKSVSGKTELYLQYEEGADLNLNQITDIWVKQPGKLGALGEYKVNKQNIESKCRWKTK